MVYNHFMTLRTFHQDNLLAKNVFVTATDDCKVTYCVTILAQERGFLIPPDYPYSSLILEAEVTRQERSEVDSLSSFEPHRLESHKLQTPIQFSRFDPRLENLSVGDWDNLALDIVDTYLVEHPEPKQEAA